MKKNYWLQHTQDRTQALSQNSADEGSQLIGLVLSVLVLILLTVIALPFFMDTYGPGDDEETDTALEMTENTVDIVDNNNAHREEQYEELDLDVTYTN